MKGLLLLLIHLVAVLARLLGPGGVRGLVAENLLLKQQLLILSRTRQRAPNLSPVERCLLGLCTLFLRPDRIPKAAVAVKTSTLLKLHQFLVRRKYRALFSGRTTGEEARPEGSVRGARPDHSGVEAAEPTVWLPENRPDYRHDVRCGYRQRCGSTCPGKAPSTRAWRRRWAVMADLDRSRQGQLVERRLVSLRIDPAEIALGPGRHGPVHASHHRVRGPCG